MQRGFLDIIILEIRLMGSKPDFKPFFQTLRMNDNTRVNGLGFSAGSPRYFRGFTSVKSI